MGNDLHKLGADVQTTEDSIQIAPPARLTPTRIECYDDHRIAMSLSLAALRAVPITILDPGCTGKTFPTYFDQFRTICR